MPTEIETLVTDLNSAFTSFKASHQGDVDELKRAVDDLNLQAAARQMNGTGAPQSESAPVDFSGVKALRTAADFRAHAALVAQRTDEDPKDRVGLGDVFRAVAGMSSTPGAVKALSRGTDTAGGYAVPALTTSGILAALAPVSSLMAAGAGVVPMEQGAKSLTVPAVAALPTASWRNEGAAIAVSEPAFRPVIAVPQSLAVIIKLTRELLADAPGMDAALQTAIAAAFAKEFDRAGLRGSGLAPEPRGLRNTDGVHLVNHGGANGATLADYSPVLLAYEALLGANAPAPSAIIAAPRTTIKWAGLKDTTNQPLRRPDLLANLPIITTSQIPVDLPAGTSNDTSEVYVGSFANMYFLQRENISIQLLREAYAATGEIGFLVHARVDVVVPYPQAFAVIKGIKA